MPCIYAGPHDEMSGDHFLPRALGRFQGFEQLYERVCRHCNARIAAETEEQFLRAGPIGFFRWVIGVEGYDGPPPNPFYRGARDAPPLVIMGRVPGMNYDLAWDVEWGTQNVFPLRQLVVEHPLAGTHAIPLFNRMRGHPEALRAELAARGLQAAGATLAFATEDEIPWVTELVEHTFGAVPPGQWITTQYEPQRLDLIVQATVTERYFRAVAKIAFHYTLKVLPDLTGMEPEFDGIKEFIWNGGDAGRFVVERRQQFIGNFHVGMRPNRWMHVLAVERSHQHVVARVQFFLGPQHLPFPYEVSVGRNPRRVYVRRQLLAHIFAYQGQEVLAGFDGVTEDARPVAVWL